MRIGVSLQSSYSVTDPRAGARDMIEQARAARDAGLDSLFVGDHHSTAPASYYQNTPILGRLLAEWNDRLAGALFLLPLWNPVLLAEQVGTLAAVAEGRFAIQVAIGAGAEQFAGIGSTLHGRTARFERGLGIVRRLLAGDEVTDDDGPWRIRGARIAPVPRDPVEVWIGATAPAAVDRAARLGDAWVCNANVLPDDARDQAARYLAGSANHGRIPTAVAIRRDVYVGADPGAARARVEAAVSAGYRGFQLEAFLFGDIEGTAAMARGYAAMGYTDLVLRPFGEQQEALATIARLADVRAAVAGA